ncbi:MAG: beta-ketoacyl-ACP synthase III [Phycisphaerae bacterium]
MKMPVSITGSGTYLPEEVLTNAYFAERLDTTDEWIVTRTGIRERHRAAEDESTSTMATQAALKAIEDAGLTPQDIDAVVCATATGDHPFPATATYMHAQLGLKDVPAFDISAACAGFLYGCCVASGFIGSGMYRRVLVAGAETLSRYADPTDRSTVVIFGDGAGAAVLEATEPSDAHSGVLYFALGCDGTRANHIVVPSGGARMPTTESTLAERLQYLRMKGREVYKFAVIKMQELIDEALRQANVTPDELAMVIPHQSNLRIIESVREKLGLSRDKIAVNIDRCGNTSAASIPMALDEARREGRLKKGDLILMVGIGAGITWSTMLVRL